MVASIADIFFPVAEEAIRLSAAPFVDFCTACDLLLVVVVSILLGLCHCGAWWFLSQLIFGM